MLRELRKEHMHNGNKALMSLIRRSFVLAGCCICSDLALVFIVKTIHVKFPDAVFAPLVAYDVNLILNFICMIITFRKWKRALLPWYFRPSLGAIVPQTSMKIVNGKSSLTMSTIT